jgi:hypothetical protein
VTTKREAVTSFSDWQMKLLQDSARGLPVDMRGLYLQTIASLLVAGGEHGDAAVAQSINLALDKVHELLMLKADPFHESTSIYPRRKVDDVVAAK